MKSQNVETERQPHCLRGRVKDSFRLYSKCQRQPQSKISYMLDIFRIGNLSFCCAASWRSKLKSHSAPSLEIELLWTCAFLKWIQKFKAHFRCLMQTIMVSLTLQSLWRWEYQNIFLWKWKYQRLRYAKGLAMFTMKNVERERKLRFLFDIYDIDGDGLICNSELYKVGECQQLCRLSICKYIGWVDKINFVSLKCFENDG